jgi:hypothetical protein
VCEVAPYGRGEETVVDSTVRSCYQLPPKKLEIKNKSFITMVFYEFIPSLKLIC